MISYPKPEDCPVCRKGIFCPIHPGSRIECEHHKLKHIQERERALEEELKREAEEKKKRNGGEREKEKEKELRKAKKIWD